MKSNDENYIERLRKGREDALEFIIDKYMPLVKGTVYKVLSPLDKDGIIDECMNDIFLSIWNNRKKFIGQDEDFKKWVYKISRFKAIDYYRKEIKNKEIAVEQIQENNIEKNKSAEDELLILENRKEAVKLINTLEEVDRKIFTMKFLLGIKPDEIAYKLGMTRTAVDTRVHRGRKKLSKNCRTCEMEGI